jgi:probable lipoprotein NlpC
MRGIQYIYDNNGNKVKAAVDLRRYGKEFALFVQAIAKQQQQETRKNNNSMFSSTPVRPPVVGDTISNLGAGGTVNTRAIKVNALIESARSYFGVPYRTGGTTRSGMDCSGFTQTSFKSIGLSLPRVSRDQAKVGEAVAKNQLKEGDLLFFATGTPGRINHVGIVVDASNHDDIRFIHASSSRGVMEASTSVSYWSRTYIKGQRVV